MDQPFGTDMFKKVSCAALLLILAAGCASSGRTTDNGWRPLFDGKSVERWTQRNGQARYYVENGELVGVATADQPNSFLSPPGEYGDFILEYEFKVDPRMNSGVQIRSLSTPDFKDGRVHGYQVEIDPSERAWTAGVYDEARRGWLYSLENNPKAQQAFKQNDWNHVRVEAIGDTIRTWLNGRMAANLIDPMTPRGFIAFQVHSINDPALAGAQVRWRNIRIKTEDLESARLPVDPAVPARRAPEKAP